MPGAGASSSSFWWRRCTEQSRSNRCTTSPCAIREHLHLDMARRRQVALEQQRASPNERAASPRARLERALQLARRRARCACPCRRRRRCGFTMQREAELRGLASKRASCTGRRPRSRAPPGRPPSPCASSRCLRAHRRDRGRRRTDERESRLLARLRETPRSRERKPYPGCIASQPARCASADQLRDVEIALAQAALVPSSTPRPPPARGSAPRRPPSRPRRCGYRAVCAVRAMRHAISPRFAISRLAEHRRAPTSGTRRSASSFSGALRAVARAEREDAAAVERVDHAVVPQPRARVVRMALRLVLLADRRLELASSASALQARPRAQLVAARSSRARWRPARRPSPRCARSATWNRKRGR